MVVEDQKLRKKYSARYSFRIITIEFLILRTVIFKISEYN
jgi:hypothetical protein